MSEFLDAFNATLPDFETMFGELWVFKGITYPAIAIDQDLNSTRVMKGGSYDEVKTTIYVRTEVFDASGIKQDDTLTARGQDFSILEIQGDGDQCVIVMCGSPQIDVWGR